MVLELGWLSTRIEEPSAQGIAASIARLVRHGEISPGTRLPAVRDLAAALYVSPATVSSAWGLLRNAAIIEGRGRQGSWIADVLRGPSPKRFEDIATYWPRNVIDVSLAAPDPALLPDLRAALLTALTGEDINSYKRSGITAELRSAVPPTWPFPAEDWLATNGGFEGVRLILSSTLVPGDVVALSDPSIERLIDILESVGARIVPVATDDDGPVPESLAEALRRRPALFLYEPRVSSRLGRSMTTERRDALTRLLRPTSTLIIEDDGLGDLAAAPAVSLGSTLPDRTAMVRSYSKPYGPDLRVAVIGGSSHIVERARGVLQYGTGWTSRILQNAVAHLITDPDVQETVRAARQAYAQRRSEMIRLLADRKVTATGPDGLSIAVQVADEQQALLVLASHGIATLSGSTASLRAKTPFVRLAIGRVFPDPARIADAFALAASAL